MPIPPDAMRPLIEAGQLVTDLECNHFDLLNVAFMIPVPQNLVDDSDVRLSNARSPAIGSVTNESVAADAAIEQSKLSLDGVIPSSWLGFDPDTAAPGDLVEYKALKGQPDGYAELDSSGQVPVGQLPATIGTITSIDLTMPAEFVVSGGPVTSTGTIAVDWDDVADGSWFGNDSGGSGPPIFQTSPIPTSLVPDLDASKITSGTIAAARLPAAVGVGAGHKSGLVPDPGASGTATDYLARDMSYKAVPSMGPTYQPIIPDPTFSATVGGGNANVAIVESLDGASIFYSLTDATTDFQPYTGPFDVATPQDVWAYAAKEGYTNSNVVTESFS